MNAPYIRPTKIRPAENKFHLGNVGDGKHYWLTPPDLYAKLNDEFNFDFDPCPYPLPDGFDGLTCEWGKSNYVNPPFGSIMHDGKKKGPTAWVRKALEEWRKGKRVVLVYPVEKWLLLLVGEILGEHAQIRNLGDVKWVAIEDGSTGKGTGRHIACFILEPLFPAQHRSAAPER
jgi:DNA N-6-adenine-methyltransferase (Dam).